MAQRVPASSPTQSDAVIPAVVQLLAIGPGDRGKNRECSATGFLINEEGFILTNAHVIDEAKQCLAGSGGAKILAKLANSDSGAAKAVSCDLVGLDERHDLAVLEAERPLSSDASSGQRAFVFLDPLEVGDNTPVRVTGHPVFAWQPVTQTGKVVGRKSLRISEKDTETTEVLVLNIALQRGNSGSPVYLEAGSGVVGIVERRDPLRPSQTVAVPVRYAIDLMDRHRVRWHASLHESRGE